MCVGSTQHTNILASAHGTLCRTYKKIERAYQHAFPDAYMHYEVDELHQI